MALETLLKGIKKLNAGSMPESIYEVEVFVIYHNYADYPGKFVVKRWELNWDGQHPDRQCHVFETLTEARDFIPDSMRRIERDDRDVASIVETWI